MTTQKQCFNKITFFCLELFCLLVILTPCYFGHPAGKIKQKPKIAPRHMKSIRFFFKLFFYLERINLAEK